MVSSLLGHALDLEGRAFVLAEKGGTVRGPAGCPLSYKDIKHAVRKNEDQSLHVLCQRSECGLRFVCHVLRSSIQVGAALIPALVSRLAT